MRTRNLLVALLAISLLFAGVVSYYASSSPDGLEKVSEDHGIAGQAKDHDLDDSPWPTTASAVSTIPASPPVWPGWPGSG